jgi:hypothetical protein
VFCAAYKRKVQNRPIISVTTKPAPIKDLNVQIQGNHHGTEKQCNVENGASVEVLIASEEKVLSLH